LNLNLGVHLLNNRISGIIEKEATIYIQSYNSKDKETSVYVIIPLKKGKMNDTGSFETYASNARILYAPTKHGVYSKDSLNIHIETGNE
jgi:hypothetical protein